MLEEALRSFLGVEVLERVWSRSDLSDEQALQVAYDELHQMRRRRARQTD